MLRLLAHCGLSDISFQAPVALIRISGGHDIALTARDENKPPAVAALCPHTAGASADDGATLRGIHSIEHDEPRVVGKAIGIFEGMVKPDFERQPRLVGDEIEFTRAGQNVAPTDPIVKHKPEPQQ